ncbi:MAG: heparinase II/III domain-containing protein [Bacteroidales bacterium]
MKNTLLFFCLIVVIASARVTNTMAQTTYPLSGHPKLFFLASDTAVLRAKLNSTPVLKQVHDLTIAECDKMLTLPVQKRVLLGKRLLVVSREAVRRISFLSYAYRMTLNNKYAVRAESEMTAMANFSDWNPSHFLDVAEMTMAMAIGYDWLYSYLSTTSRTKIATAIKQKGIEQTTGTKANQSWLTSKDNWNQVCNSGISAGVAAVYDENPTYYQPLINRAVKAIRIPMANYKDNGSYPEGMGYWDYGTTYNALFIDLLQKTWGTDSSLISTPGFLTTVNFVCHMQGTGTKQLNSSGGLSAVSPQVFNFADCGNVGALPAMYWLADRKGDSSVLYNELQKLTFSLANSPSTLTNNRFLPFLLIWSTNLTLNNLPGPTELTYVGQGNSAVGALRTGWGANDIYLAVKGGTSTQGHSHMDVGSFVMDAMDVRWAMDYGASDYNNLETNGVDLWNMTQTSERWDVFRINNKAHNTLTINGKSQLIAGKATIDNLVNTSNLKSVEMNLTSLYKMDVTNCKRTASIVSNRYVEIKDDVTASATPLTIRWNILTQALPQKISNKIIRLTQSTKILYLVFEGTENVTAKSWSTRPSTTFEEQNNDTYFAGFEYTVAASAKQIVTVKLVPAGDPILSGLDLTMPGVKMNETFETYNLGEPTNGFLKWEMNPSSSWTIKAILGEIATNPFKAGINTSDKVLKITRQEDSTYVTSANAASQTFRGVQAYNYDLSLNTNSILEFKYYKNAPGKIGVRIYDGIGNVAMVDYTDPNEQTANYSTAQWRTVQFAVGKQNISKFSYSPSGYLLITPEREVTEAAQEKELIMYVDDVKLLPLPTSLPIVKTDNSITAYYDPSSNRICVRNLPENTKQVKLYNITGQLIDNVLVAGDVALLDCRQNAGRFYLVQAVNQNGSAIAIKVAK